MIVLLLQTRTLKASALLVRALRGRNGKMDRAGWWRWHEAWGNRGIEWIAEMGRSEAASGSPVVEATLSSTRFNTLSNAVQVLPQSLT